MEEHNQTFMGNYKVERWELLTLKVLIKNQFWPRELNPILSTIQFMKKCILNLLVPWGGGGIELKEFGQKWFQTLNLNYD